MALITLNYAASNVDLDIEDYTTPTPLEVPITTLEGDISIPIERTLDVEDLFPNATGGKEHSGTAVNGRAAPPTFTIPFIAIDIADNSEVTAPVALFLALSNNSVTGTAYSSHVYTSQLTLGGKLQAKAVYTLTDAGGNTSTITVPFRVDSVDLAPVGGKYNVTVNCTVVGAITRA